MRAEEIMQVLHNGLLLLIDGDDVIAVVQQPDLLMLRRNLVMDKLCIARAGHVVFSRLQYEGRRMNTVQSRRHVPDETVDFRQGSKREDGISIGRC